MIEVTCAIIIHNKKILITQRGPDSDHPLKWEFPGGKIKNEESAKACITREISEELSIGIRILKRLKTIEYDYGFKRIRLIPFLCKIRNGEFSLNEHHDYKWITSEQLGEFDFSEADRKLIVNTINQEILEKYLGENMNNTG